MGKHYTEEESERVNDPEFVYICKKCGLPKPNKEYARSNHSHQGRRYVTHCKGCRNEYTKRQYTLERKRQMSRAQRTKNRLTVLYSSSRGNAKKRGIEHTITLHDIKELFKQQLGLCYYTHVPMFDDLTGVEGNDDSVSLDRIDSSRGYIKGNIVLCRWVVNRIKNDLSIEKLVEILKQIEQHGNNKGDGFQGALFG